MLIKPLLYTVSVAKVSYTQDGPGRSHVQSDISVPVAINWSFWQINLLLCLPVSFGKVHIGLSKILVN